MKQKTLILIRHGKAVERADFDGKDFHRPLTEEGKEELKKFFSLIKDMHIVTPEYIVTSEAVRCAETAEILRKIFEVKTENFKQTRDLYNDHEEKRNIKDYYEVLEDFNDDFHTCVVVGHNNTLTHFASDICGEKVPHMKKWSVMIIEIDKHELWKKVWTESGKLLAYIAPDIC